MNAANQRQEDLFDAARKVADAAERRTFLDRACDGDAALRGRLESLLAAAGEADRFFAEGSSSLGKLASFSGTRSGEPGLAGTLRAHLPADEPIGARIGRYKLLQKIGEGGCGVVYLSEQEEPVRRRVALKIIKLGMETKSVIARFEAERQALALMDHPNIARVFDAGATERGSPYFVMELVRGVRITEFCDQNRLDTRQRLGLFIQICHAIQHAHQKGIIHGDIKPSNIMVARHDGVPVPKVIDFGIATATEARLTDEPLFTVYVQLIGTPTYMSPEQTEMSGLGIDTRSDIYSLGVLLYEMLTSKTPFDAKELLEFGIDGMRRILWEREPPRPSARVAALAPEELARMAACRQTESGRLVAAIRGDLDWIVMRALEKDRARRYETANGLAMDLQRYLDFEPVTARPPSRLYRLKKLVRRNRVVFAAGGAGALALVVGLGISTWLFVKEREARHRAVAAEQQEAQLRRDAEMRERITQAALLVSQGRLEQADILLSAVSFTQPTVEGAAVLRSIGEWHALEHRWKQASDRFALLLQVDQLDGVDVATLDHLERGPALVELGDAGGYEHFRQDAIARFSGTPCPFADRIVKISLLLPANSRTIESLNPLVEATTKALAEADASGDKFSAAWRSISLALFEYRRGDYPKAAEWCRVCLDYPQDNAPRSATAYAILAMAYRQLGRPEEARSGLATSREIIQSRSGSSPGRGTPVLGFWFDWALVRILLHEAGALIEAPARAAR